MRAQLVQPDQAILSPQAYLQIGRRVSPDRS
jgi:hypothetical protein